MISNYLQTLSTERVARISHAALILSAPGEHYYAWAEDAEATTVAEHVLSNLRVYDQELYWRVLAIGFERLFKAYSDEPSDFELKDELDRFGFSVSILKRYFNNDLGLADYNLGRSTPCLDFGGLYTFLLDALALSMRSSESVGSQLKDFCSAYLDRVREEAAILYRMTVSVVLEKLGVSTDSAKAVLGSGSFFILEQLNTVKPYFSIDSSPRFWTTAGRISHDNSNDDGSSSLDLSVSVETLFGDIGLAAQAFSDLFEAMSECNPSMNYKKTVSHFFASTTGESSKPRPARCLDSLIRDALVNLADFELRTFSDPESPEMVAYEKRMADLQHWSCGW